MALKQQLIARLTAVNAVSAAQLARETGISQQNLSRWLCETRNSALGTQNTGSMCAWTGEQKARIIAHAADLAGDELTSYLEAEGVSLVHFRRWRLSLEEAGEQTVSMAKQIGRLERELARKERALAEAATLLMLREKRVSQEHSEQDIGDAPIEQTHTLPDWFGSIP